MTAAVAKTSATDHPLLRVQDLDKHFGPVQALYHVNLDLPSGQVTALSGDNGAGKTVLTKCVAGIYQSDHGQFLWQGHPGHDRDPPHSASLGLHNSYPGLAIAANLDVVQHMCVRRDERRSRRDGYVAN